CGLSTRRRLRAVIVPNGGCELRRRPRFSWAKVSRSIDENVASICRECSRADSLCVVSSPRLIVSLRKYRTTVAHVASACLQLFDIVAVTPQPYDLFVSEHVSRLRFGY